MKWYRNYKLIKESPAACHMAKRYMFWQVSAETYDWLLRGVLLPVTLFVFVWGVIGIFLEKLEDLCVKSLIWGAPGYKQIVAKSQLLTREADVILSEEMQNAGF